MKGIVLQLAVVLACVALAAGDAPAQTGGRTYSLFGVNEGTKLGVSLQDVTKRLKERKKLAVDEGAYVSTVMEESPAEKAGIEEGDVIVKFDGADVADADDLTRAVKRAGTDEPVSLVLNRKGETKSLTVKLRKPSRAHSYSYSFGDHGDHDITVVPPVPRAPQPFRFRMMTMQSVEGMELQKLSKQLAEYFEVPGGRGLLVTEVERRSAAADAGVKAGDVIVKVNSFAVKDIDDLREELYEREAATASLEIVRKGKPQTLTLKVEERDDDEDEDDELSFEFGVPSLPHMDRSAARSSLSDANREFLRELHETLNLMQDRIREKMERLHEKISNKVLRM